MAIKKVEVPEIGTVVLKKRRGQRTMRLRVDSQGVVSVSVPWLVPQTYALDFVKSKMGWIKQQQQSTSFEPYHGMEFGKSQQLLIAEHSSAQKSRIKDFELRVDLPTQLDLGNSEQLAFIQKSMARSLKREAEKLLLPRLEELATEHGFEYSDSKIKQLTGRWGSCDSKGSISLSLYLVQLPWHLIDYVLIHELTHTMHLNHSAKFWAQVEDICPDHKQAKKELRLWQPRVYTGNAFVS